MEEQAWFDAHEGPKTLGWDPERGAFICGIAWNERRGNCVTGNQCEGVGKNPEEAIAHAKRQMCEAGRCNASS